jgi:Mn-containing catalase
LKLQKVGIFFEKMKLGGPNGELSAAIRYLSQRYSQQPLGGIKTVMGYPQAV